jgi:hypothetical protein
MSIETLNYESTCSVFNSFEQFNNSPIDIYVKDLSEQSERNEQSEVEQNINQSAIEDQQTEIFIGQMISSLCLDNMIPIDNCKKNNNSGNMCLWNSLTNFIDDTPENIFKLAKEHEPSSSDSSLNIGDIDDINITLNNFYNRLIIFECECGKCTNTIMIKGSGQGNIGLVHQGFHWMPTTQGYVDDIINNAY